MQNIKENIGSSLGGWRQSVVATECTLHQLSPYIGKMKSLMAHSLIENYSKANDTIYDPFVGCGTIALESWIMGRNIITNDLSPYAYFLTMGKLHPLKSKNKIIEVIEKVSKEIKEEAREINLEIIPQWVRDFFNEETLKEIITWRDKLISQNEHFLLSCLLGILHHQRPGFLSYPSSHTVPYLRNKKFPESEFPELYSYRELKIRLQKKALRAIRRLPNLDESRNRICYRQNSEILESPIKVDSIISSPPYMRRLDYGRDNRLRLWVVGEEDWKGLDKIVSPSESDFLISMEKCFRNWLSFLKDNGKCVLVFDNSMSKKYKIPLVDVIVKIACEKVGGYIHIGNFEDEIPNERRVRRNHSGSKSEIIVVLEKLKVSNT